MNLSSRLRRIECTQCGWTRTYGPEEMLKSLRAAGMLRRDAKPDHQLVLELFTNQLATNNCEMCGEVGLKVGEWTDEFDDCWGESRRCEVCKKTIPSERLEIFPNEVRCASCKDKPAIEEPEFCSFCGGLMQTRKTNGAGITRYKSICRDCGKS